MYEDGYWPAALSAVQNTATTPPAAAPARERELHRAPLFLSQPGSESKRTPPLRAQSHCKNKLAQQGFMEKINNFTSSERGLYLGFLTVW